MILLAIMLLAASSGAEEAWRVQIDCPELDAEARAQLEVRHLVELQGLPGPPKTMVLICGAESLEGRWERDGVVLSRRLVTRTGSDDVLELAHWMASVLVGVRSATDPAKNTDNAEAVVQADGEPERGAESAPESVTPKAAETSATQPAEPESPPPAPKNSAPAGSSGGVWDLGLGVGYQHYGAQVPGSLGPMAHGTWSALSRVGVGGALGYQWGLRSAAGLSVEEGVLAAHARVAILNWFGILAGPSATFVRFRGSEALGGGSANAVTVGGELLIRAETPQPGWGGFVAAGLRISLPEQQARLDGETVLELPAVRGALTLGLRYKNRE